VDHPLALIIRTEAGRWRVEDRDGVAHESSLPGALSLLHLWYPNVELDLTATRYEVRVKKPKRSKA